MADGTMRISVYRRLIGACLRGQASYRASFALECLAQALAQATELVVILVLFSRITALAGFSTTEVLLIYALAGTAFGIADLVAGQLDDLPRRIRTGTFDVLLLRPLGTLAQMLVTDLQLRRIARVVASIAVLGYALAALPIDWTIWTIVLVICTPLAGAVILGSIWVIACAICFWLVEGRELANTVTYGSSLFTSYPLPVFSGWLRRLLAFVVPGAFVSYYPALALLDRRDPLGAPGWISWLSPVVAITTAACAAAVWRFAVAHYRGTGS